MESERWACPDCGATFPAEQTWCPVCSNADLGSCGSRTPGTLD